MPGQGVKKKMESADGRDSRRSQAQSRVSFRAEGSQLKSVKLLGKLRRWYQASKIGFCIKNDQIRMPSC